MMDAVDGFTQQAFGVLTGTRARDAFDLDAEPRAVRERYGFIPEYKAPTPDRCGVPAWSQRMLLARRLVEAGCGLVTVDLPLCLSVFYLAGTKPIPPCSRISRAAPV